jgi:hypothetical protein
MVSSYTGYNMKVNSIVQHILPYLP